MNVISIIEGISNLCLLILTLLVFIIGIALRKRHKELSHLFIYPASSFIQEFYVSIAFFSVEKKSSYRIALLLEGISVHLFISIEFICIYYFFYKVSILTNFSKQILKLFFIAFFCIYFLFAELSNDFILSYGKIYLIQSCFILLPSFIYIYQLFNNPPILKLAAEPSFWFNAGILMFFILTLPFFSTIKYYGIPKFSHYKNSIYNIGYIIIFLFLVKSYLCKSKIMT